MHCDSHPYRADMSHPNSRKNPVAVTRRKRPITRKKLVATTQQKKDVTASAGDDIGNPGNLHSECLVHIQYESVILMSETNI